MNPDFVRTMGYKMRTTMKLRIITTNLHRYFTILIKLYSIYYVSIIHIYNLGFLRIDSSLNFEAQNAFSQPISLSKAHAHGSRLFPRWKNTERAFPRVFHRRASFSSLPCVRRSLNPPFHHRGVNSSFAWICMRFAISGLYANARCAPQVPRLVSATLVNR